MIMEMIINKVIIAVIIAALVSLVITAGAIYIDGKLHESNVEVYNNGELIYSGPKACVSTESAGDATRVNICELPPYKFKGSSWQLVL